MIRESIIYNELITEKSPYLKQYIDNPIQWNKWNESVFSKAKIENKPIFVFMGSYLCKKCYQMNKECFLDIEIAKVLNDNFMAVNVDIQEEPLLYEVYSKICKAIKKDIKLPYVMIMDHNKQVFFAESTLPKIENENKPGLLDVLTTISNNWHEDKERLLNLAKEITMAVKDNLNSYEIKAKLSKDSIDKAIYIYKYCFHKWENDEMDKFLQISPQNLIFLIDYYKQYKDEYIFNMLQKITKSIYKSKAFDHIGGGFFMYEDNELSLKKTLYINALMAIIYIEMFSITGDEEYKNISGRILEYILTNHKSNEGGFIAQIGDNTKEKEEEYYKFYPHEIIQILGDVEGEEFNKYFNLKGGTDSYQKELPSISENKRPYDIDISIIKVLNYRNKRRDLKKDERVFTTENALLIVALSRAYIILNDERYIKTAKKTLEFIEKELIENNKIYMQYYERKASGEGTINEYASVALSFLEIYGVTFNKEYLNRAFFFVKQMLNIFSKKEEPGLYLVDVKRKDMLFNIKIYKDAQKISGNSIATYVIYQLGEILKDVELTEYTKKEIQNIMGNIYQEPLKYSIFLIVLEKLEKLTTA